MITISAVYPNRAGSRFDADDYRDRHVPFATALLGPHGLAGLRMSAGQAGLDGSPPPFWMITEMRFPTRAAFDAAIAADGTTLFADLPNFTDVEPILQLSADGVEFAAPAFMETRHDA